MIITITVMLTTMAMTTAMGLNVDRPLSMFCLNMTIALADVDMDNEDALTFTMTVTYIHSYMNYLCYVCEERNHQRPDRAHERAAEQARFID